MDLFYEKCSQHNLRMTPQRLEIFKVVLKAKDHPSADTLYKRVRKIFPNISFDTVYRTLLSFSKIGIVNLVEGYGEEKRFDPNIYNHHHLRCIKCHKIVDFTCPEYDTIKIPREIKNKFTITGKRVILEGLCTQCKR